jgi:hypothetical protein
MLQHADNPLCHLYYDPNTTAEETNHATRKEGRTGR